VFGEPDGTVAAMQPGQPGEVVARGSRSTVRAYGEGVVIKVPAAETPAGWILSEAQYTQAVRAVGAPAPRLLGIEEVAGRPASVWERLEGTSMWKHVIDHPDRSAAMGGLMADVQLALFELVPPVTLPDQRDRLTSKIRRSAATVDSTLISALELLPDGDVPPRLCHGDLHPSNVILTDNGPMLVDWFDASRGDRVGDVARSSLTLLADGAHTPSHLPGADAATLRRLTEAYLQRLRENMGIDEQLLARWQAVNAAARLAEGVAPGPLLAVWERYVAPPRAAAG
jgi:aminoglycoside phosphotransferase (APT) family kinase protein